MSDISKKARQTVKDLMEKENVYKIHSKSCELLLEMADIIDDLEKQLADVRDENKKLN